MFEKKYFVEKCLKNNFSKRIFVKKCLKKNSSGTFFFEQIVGTFLRKKMLKIKFLRSFKNISGPHSECSKIFSSESDINLFNRKSCA